MAIGVDCPCGKSISSWADNVPYLADFLPEQHTDAYCAAIEDAIRQHPGDPEITASFAIDRAVGLFRQVWQCPTCGRVLVLGPDRKYHAFVPELPDTPRDVLAGTRQAESGAADGGAC
jgi:hypothetical protein